MKIIVGLGNPGKKFEKTRHNIGSRIIDEFFRKNRDVHIFSDFKFSKKFETEISKGIFNKKEIILAKPQTFMNLSGKAVKILMSNVKCQMSNLLVIHDDIDLPLGKIKISIGRGSAGHKGVQSIIENLRTKDFIRFRIGIQPKTGKPKNVEDFVLKKFNVGEKKIIEEVIERTCQAIEFYLKEELEKAMTKYNL